MESKVHHGPPLRSPSSQVEPSMGFVKIDFIIIKCLFKQMPPPFHTPGDQGGGGSSNNFPPQQWKHAETLTQPECEKRGAYGRGDKPRPHSEQGMYENSCINLSSPPAPRPQQGREENDAKEKLNESDEQNKANPTPGFCPPAPGLSQEDSWQGGAEGRSGVGSGPLWLGLSPSRACAVEARGRKLG